MCSNESLKKLRKNSVDKKKVNNLYWTLKKPTEIMKKTIRSKNKFLVWLGHLKLNELKEDVLKWTKACKRCPLNTCKQNIFFADFVQF